VPEDEAVTVAAAAGKPLVLYTKDGASRACVNIAKRILGIKTPLMKMK
jgi:Septum formation inhibitor-activating ATPase